MSAQRFLLAGILLGVMGMTAACAATGGTRNPASTGAAQPAVDCFGVLPVQVAVAEDQAPSAEEAKALATGAAVVDGLLRNILAGNGKAKFVDADQIGALQPPEAMIRLESSREVARSAGCSALLETSVSRYVEREGGPYGVEQPAAVTLAYRLYEVNRGTVLCHGRFEEQQQAVMDNLFSIGKAGRRGITWVTAEELAREGLAEQLQQCSVLAR